MASWPIRKTDEKKERKESSNVSPSAIKSEAEAAREKQAQERKGKEAPSIEIIVVHPLSFFTLSLHVRLWQRRVLMSVVNRVWLVKVAGTSKITPTSVRLVDSSLACETV
jgi:hypothetical protein